MSANLVVGDGDIEIDTNHGETQIQVEVHTDDEEQVSMTDIASLLYSIRAER